MVILGRTSSEKRAGPDAWTLRATIPKARSTIGSDMIGFEQNLYPQRPRAVDQVPGIVHLFRQKAFGICLLVAMRLDPSGPLLRSEIQDGA